MKYFYLLTAGVLVSIVHYLLVWPHREYAKATLSEYAIRTKRSHLVYFITHVITEIFFLLFSYQFYMVEHHLLTPFILNIIFAILDFLQAALPSRGKTEKAHWALAYVSWLSYISAGVLTLFLLPIAQPYSAIGIILLVPVIYMFVYMHFNRSKLYPYQLSIVPLFVLYMYFVTVGAS